MVDVIKEAVVESFAEVQRDLIQEMFRVIESLTEFEGFDGQDIVDTGRLRDSMIIDSTAMKLILYWIARDPKTGFYYPAAIILGFFAFGIKWIPGRNFPVRAVQNISPTQLLVEKLKARGIKARVIHDHTNLL